MNKKDRSFFPFTYISKVKKQKAADKRNKEIDSQLRRESNLERRTAPQEILVIGGKGAGKTCLIEQFKIHLGSEHEIGDGADVIRQLRTILIEFLKGCPALESNGDQWGRPELLPMDPSDLGANDVIALTKICGHFDVINYCLKHHQRILQFDGNVLCSDTAVLH